MAIPKNMVNLLVGKIAELLLERFDNQLSIEENEDVKRGLEKAKSLVVEFTKSEGG